ncbi:DNA repair protein RAD52 homolog isoform X2 [Amyelois transitella]|uniref:DNA repair protein RAD52 homolog isoform X2 n=1 Tax=Amyelois transitella TaxID=680683 RepID=UPI00298F6B67|nr:DNA repair protein RAD52 homolog isoform X2 [Amyelois transitella]
MSIVLFWWTYPDSIMPHSEPQPCEEDTEHRRQQLINFGHSQWGFNNWSWTVTKQELDFVDPAGNGKYTAGVVAFVSITVKSFDIQRENIGYATSVANSKGMAIYKSRKCAVTNALRETLLSFGGSVATELMELSEIKTEAPSAPNPVPTAPVEPENNQNLPNKPIEPKNSPVNKVIRKEESTTPANVRPHPPPAIKNMAGNPPPPPVAKAHPMPVSLPRAAPRGPAPPPRPNSNEAEMSEEEARAERKRRQRLAQEEFRLKQLAKNAGNDDKELSKAGSSIDKMLMDIPTQDIVIEESGTEDGKRKSPADGGAAKRRTSVLNRLDIVAD